MALWALFLLVAFTQDSLFALNDTSTTSLPETLSTAIASTTATLTVSDTTQSRTDVTSKAAASSMPQSTKATSNTMKTTDFSTSQGSMVSSTRSKEPLTSQMAQSVNGSTQTGQPSPEPAFSTKPGLVVVICLFVLILVIGTVVVLIKCCRLKKPAFRKLDEVPMGNVAEDSPFARYPPK